MTTIDDKATEQEERFRALALAEWALQAKQSHLVATGECLECGEEDLPDGSPFFCCIECARDYERRVKAKRIAGI